MTEIIKKIVAEGVNPKDIIGANKPPLHLLPSAALVEMAMVMGEGARKYGAYNWREKGKPVQHMTYTGAALRHILAHQDGETIDPESGRPHLALAMAGLGILIDAQACGNAVDNRPGSAPTAQMIRDYTKQTPPTVTPSAVEEVADKIYGGVPASKKWEDHLSRLISQELNAYPVGASMNTGKLADLIHAAWQKEANEITGREPIEDALRNLRDRHPQYGPTSFPDTGARSWISLGPNP